MHELGSVVGVFVRVVGFRVGLGFRIGVVLSFGVGRRLRRGVGAGVLERLLVVPVARAVVGGSGPVGVAVVGVHRVVLRRVRVRGHWVGFTSDAL
ncbi:hypothetical protein ACFQRB_02255 [Halobaculum litoreum]|uniref:Uncharacterized protein n=1 Tax=Halobaculum litoreum TaxID=3031998 RepID=A0ABD5XKY4_9EURY